MAPATLREGTPPHRRSVAGLDRGRRYRRLSLWPTHPHEPSDRFSESTNAPSEADRTNDDHRNHCGRSIPIVAVLIVLKVVFVLFVFLVPAVVGMSRRAMRLMDLVIPELAIGPVPGKQLGMRAALDRPAP